MENNTNDLSSISNRDSIICAHPSGQHDDRHHVTPEDDDGLSESTSEECTSSSGESRPINFVEDEPVKCSTSEEMQPNGGGGGEATTMSSTNTTRISNESKNVDDKNQNGDIAMIDATMDEILRNDDDDSSSSGDENNNNNITTAGDEDTNQAEEDTTDGTARSEDDSGSSRGNDKFNLEETTTQVQSEEGSQQEVVQQPVTSVTTTTNTSFGGLSNLGNTCYMASALQMLASLDHFAARIAEEEPDSNEDDGARASRLKLRNAYIDVVRRLANGETVRPDTFKSAIDERSPLFVGFLQQDAHEFLTTLLDLLDEDYKYVVPPASPAVEVREETTETLIEDKTQQREEKAVGGDCGTEQAGDLPPADESKPDLEVNEVSEISDTSMDDEYTTPERADIDGTETDGIVNEFSTVPHDEEYFSASEAEDQPMPPTAPLGCDSERTAETSKSGALVESICLDDSFQRSGLFSELDVDGIDSLLHGSQSCRSMTIFPAAESSIIEPRYKLVGGRMSASDISALPLSDLDASMSSQPMAIETHSDIASQGSLDNISLDGSEVCSHADGNDDDHDYKSPVDSTFSTSVRARLTCDSCKYTRTHNEKYLHLSLEIGANGAATSVDESLRKFFAPELREIKCEKCFCETATQTLEITRLPRALLLHFKRFIVDVSPDYTSITYRKNQSAVAFDEHLFVDSEDANGGFSNGCVLTEFLARDCVIPQSSSTMKTTSPSYAVRSVVNHIGSSASCGHYTADSDRFYRHDEKRRWTRFNDSSVRQVSKKEAIEDSQKTAYLVMYELE